MVDILIIGAGAAGLTAAIYAKRAGHTAVVLDRGTYGGQAAITNEIENYPAVEKITGVEFAMRLYRQALDQGADVRFEEVTRAALTKTVKQISTDAAEYQARTVILANGAKRRLLGVPGEETYTGHGVSYCATCDGAFFRGKRVAVVGGGSVALEDALYLSNLCEHVTVIHRRDRFTAETPLIRATEGRANLTVRFGATVERIEGEGGAVTSAVLRTGEATETLPLSAVFIAVGYEPDNGLFAGELALDPQGYIRAGEDCRTSLEGVFAAGDCRTKELRQIITAAADGAVAAFQAGKMLDRR